MLRGMVAHFVASFALSLFTFAFVTALAATALAVAGPQRFARLSVILQLALAGVVTSTVLLLPSLASAGQALSGDGTGMAGWLQTFGVSALSVVPPEQRAEVTAEIIELLKPSLCDEYGNWTADYVRLQVVARTRA